MKLSGMTRAGRRQICVPVWRVGVALVFAGAVAAAHAAPAPTQLAAKGAMAVPAPHVVPDSMAQRMQACLPCHGKEGVATPHEYFPRIAGKPAGYLFNQLRNFREGRRNNRAMSHLLENLSDDYLREIASYFGALDLPYAAPPARTPSPQVIARGQTLAQKGDATRQLPACAACHGAALTGMQPALPGLVGLPKDYLLAQIGAWRNGTRRAQAPDCMQSISKRLSEEDLGAVTTWLAMQPVPRESAPAEPSARLPLACGGVAQ